MSLPWRRCCNWYAQRRLTYKAGFIEPSMQDSNPFGPNSLSRSERTTFEYGSHNIYLFKVLESSAKKLTPAIIEENTLLPLRYSTKDRRVDDFKRKG
jgi:hypothetical protein